MTSQGKLPRTLMSVLAKPSMWVALGLLLVIIGVWSVTAIRDRQPETLDQRTMEVASQLQCPVCHGESVADAPSPLAQEMRSLIREELSQGMSAQQVITYFHARYGDEILETPPATGFTSLIWLAPALILLLGFFMLLSLAREWRAERVSALEEVGGDYDSLDVTLPPSPSSRTSGDTPLSPDERARYLPLLRLELEAEEGYPSIRKEERV